MRIINNIKPDIRTSSRPSSPLIRLTALLLCSASFVAIAHAEEISDDLTEPVASSTIVDGEAGDIEITSAGSISTEETDGFVAVTMDSSNDFYNSGLIDISDSDDAIGVYLTPGFNGTITNDGTIIVDETYERDDTDDDEDLDGPYAAGSNRFGIFLDEGDSWTGDIISTTGSSILVEGNQSSAISLRSIMNGDLTLDGSNYVTGDDAIGLDLQKDINGDILISGLVQAKGENAIAVNLEGNVEGNLTIESTIQSTGFDSIATTNYVAPSAVDDDTEALEDRLDAEVLLDNTAAVAIGGSLNEGLLINGIIDSFIDDDEADDDTKDTVEDFDENRTTGSVYSYGSGPAILISADWGEEQTGDLVIGQIHETVRDTLDDDDDDDTTETLAEFTYDESFINRGLISSNGLNVGFESTALRIEGAADGSADTIFEGGILTSGSITARAFEADATAISIGNGSYIPSITNDGAITATVSTTDGNTAAAINIEDGANVDEITNTGTITARSIGKSGDAIAVSDTSSSVKSITNTGTILSYLSGDGETVEEEGDIIAINFSDHDADTGVTFLQYRETPVDDINGDGELTNSDVTTPTITGDILFGAGNDSFTVLAGSVTGDVDFGLGDADVEISDATLTGNMYFNSGSISYLASETDITGDIHIDASEGDFAFENASSFTGQLITTDSLVGLSIVDSDIYLESGNASTLSTLSITGASELTFEIDPEDTSTSILTVDGTASIGSDAIITPVFTSLPDVLTTQTLITAGEIEIGETLNDVTLSNIPWLYNTSLEINDDVLDTLSLTFTQRTTDELGLDTNEAAAFDSLLTLFENDDTLGATIASLTTEHDFNMFYDLLIPQRTDASTRFLELQSNAAFGALDDALETASLDHETDRTRVWAQEYFVSLEHDGLSGTPGYNGDGFGLSTGADISLGKLDTLGVMIGFSSGEFAEKTGGDNPVTTTSLGIGTYAVEQFGPVNLRLAGIASRVSFLSERNIEFDNGLAYEIDGEWKGWSLAASAAATSTYQRGWFYARPKVGVDWLSLSQDGYTETGGDILNAEIGAVDTDRLTASATLALGGLFDMSAGYFRIETEAGLRSTLSSTPFSSTVSYQGADTSFILNADEENDQAAIFGLALTGGSDRATFNFGYNLETGDALTSHYAGATLRLKF